MSRRKRFLTLALAVGVGVLVVSTLAMPATNRARTSPDSSDPGLRTRTYERGSGEVLAASKELLSTLPRWKMVNSTSDGAIHAEHQTRVFRFTDDVEIEVKARGPNQTQVDVSSASRIGKGDLGQNARNIKEFLEALDTALANATPPMGGGVQGKGGMGG